MCSPRRTSLRQLHVLLCVLRRSTAPTLFVIRRKKALQFSLKGFHFREPPIGFEPTTCSLRVSCSTPELRRHTPPAKRSFFPMGAANVSFCRSEFGKLDGGMISYAHCVYSLHQLIDIDDRPTGQLCSGGEDRTTRSIQHNDHQCLFLLW